MDTQSDKNIQKCDPKRLVPFVEIGGDILGGCLVAEARNFGEKWSVAVARFSPVSCRFPLSYSTTRLQNMSGCVNLFHFLHVN